MIHSHAERRAWSDFVVVELRARVGQGPSRWTPGGRFLDNHRDDVLACAWARDRDLAARAADVGVAVDTLRAVLRCQTRSAFNSRRWPGAAEGRRLLRDRFHGVDAAVRDVAEHTGRASS